MENATKALLIAAAVLVAIIIISLTLIIVRQGQEAVSGADLSEVEVAQFNSKFISYQGSNVSTSQVNVIFNEVFSHNKHELATGENRFVTVSYWGTDFLKGNITEVKNAKTPPRVSGNGYYKVTCEYSGTIINRISIESN